MIRLSRDYLKRFLERWVNTIYRHSLMVVLITALTTGGVLLYSVRNFKINTDLNGMISEKLPFRKLDDDFSKALPHLADTIVVVLDADTAELALSARKRMAERLRKETDFFHSAFEPGGGEFFERNGLLYLSVAELEELADKLADAQPFLALMSRDLSLRGLFSMLEVALGRIEDKEAQGKTINPLLDRMSETFERVIEDRPSQLSWQGLMLGEKEAALRRQFIILQPVLYRTKLSAAEAPLKAVRRIAKELDINERNGVKVRITGDVALSHENLIEVKNSTGAATAVSIFLVGVVLFVGLGGSGRLAFASLATLITGLIWTTGFALAFFGSLNLISITFAVLFIGLGIDYSIQFCLRYREVIGSGYSNRKGVITTAGGVGRSLLLSCITTAIGFYSFLPTAYSGVAELGLISGTGMFISLFANLTVLPALLTLFPMKKNKDMVSSPGKTLLSLPYKYFRAIIIGAVMLGLGAAVLLPKVSFDYNPLNLYSKTSESIIAIKELFKKTETQPWTISVLAKDREKARSLAKRLRTLKEVGEAITLSDFVPQDQPEKLRNISDMALFMPPKLNDVTMKSLSYDQKVEALNGLEKALKRSLLSSANADNASVRRLYETIQKFKTLLIYPVKGKRAFVALEKDLLSSLPILFNSLETSLQATPFTESDLPQELVSQYVSLDGRYRVQVLPRENILDVNALKRFVQAVRAIAPDATDAPVTIYESGRAVVSSFGQATLYALVAITLFLLVEIRSFSVTALILVPLILPMTLSAAASVLLDMPLNFANVIVVPLLLGVGVHSGIIFILRYQTEPPSDGNMLKTSTARALLVSTLTTLISTGSLSFSPHRGIASMGLLLTISFGLLILSILVLLPALIEFSGRRVHITKKAG